MSPAATDDSASEIAGAVELLETLRDRCHENVVRVPAMLIGSFDDDRRVASIFLEPLSPSLLRLLGVLVQRAEGQLFPFWNRLVFDARLIVVVHSLSLGVVSWLKHEQTLRTIRELRLYKGM
jgi:hypothetical protein